MVVVGVAIVVGSVALVGTLRNALTGDVRDATELRARELAAAIQKGELPALAIGEADEQFIQVLGPGGIVVAASDNVEGLPAQVRLSPGESTVFEPPVGDDDFVAYAVAANTPDGELTVVFGRSLDDVSDSTEAVTGLLAVAGPVLLLLVGATTWVVVGRALAPVEAIRSEVDEISTSELHRRVPVPPAEDEVARLAGTMNRMLGRLEDGQARQRRFVADAAHELRSPVASIRQVDDLLLLARVDEHRLDLAARPVDVDDVVFAEASRLRSDTTLRIDTRQVSAGRIRGDEVALQRIVRNLGDNAARHATRTVAFTLTGTDGTVELVVDDDGAGIAPVDRDRIFERFVRMDEARSRDDGGSGLGLAIVAELAAAHQATIEVTDSPLGGARFRLRFPATD
jgi:signal transduction histidine kinase